MDCKPLRPGEVLHEAAQVDAAIELFSERRRAGEKSIDIWEVDFAKTIGHSTVTKIMRGARPAHEATRKAVIEAACRAWGRHCPRAALYERVAAMLFARTQKNLVEPFFGNYKVFNKSREKSGGIAEDSAVIGACSKCLRPLFEVTVDEKVVRCGFLFNMGTRLYIFIAVPNYMRLAILREPERGEPLVGIVLWEESRGAAQVAASKLALIPEGSPWFARKDLKKQMAQLLVNDKNVQVPDGVLFGWQRLPEL